MTEPLRSSLHRFFQRDMTDDQIEQLGTAAEPDEEITHTPEPVDPQDPTQHAHANSIVADLVAQGKEAGGAEGERQSNIARDEGRKADEAKQVGTVIK